MHFQLLKVDVEQRLVYGRIDETPDRAGEVMDYATAKPQFAAWSDGMRKDSGGKNLGNVREMHQLAAAGKLVDIQFDDAKRAIEICAKIVDDGAWKKVTEGVYTGFSQGGRYVKRWQDGPFIRYTPGVGEMSIVDRPCNPGAVFQMVKADGAEAIAFRAPTLETEAAWLAQDLADATDAADWRRMLLPQPAAMIKALMPGDGEVPELLKAAYSDAEREEMAKSGEAMEDGSYPIKTKADLKDAVDAYGRAKDHAEAKAHIVKRAKALDATDMLPADWEGSTKKDGGDDKPMAKSLWNVSEMAQLLQSLTWLAGCVVGEGAEERDGSPLPARMGAWIAEGLDLLSAMAAEETAEARTALAAAVASLPQLSAEEMAKADLIKAGARHSKADKERLQAIHDHAVEMGADCPAALAKADAPTMARRAAELVEAREELAKVSGENETLQKRVAQLEAMPAPGGPVLLQPKDGNRHATSEAAAAELAKIEAMANGPDKAAALIKHQWTHG